MDAENTEDADDDESLVRSENATEELLWKTEEATELSEAGVTVKFLSSKCLAACCNKINIADASG